MKDYDEMDRSVRLRSESIGFKVLLLGLVVWALYDVWNYWFNSGERETLAMTLAMAGALTQQLSMRAIKQRMVAGDDEYKESNELFRIIVLSLCALAVIFSFGSYLASVLN